MGSFNKIGFISSLPIMYGDETTLVFMLPNKYNDNKHSGVCYSTDWYEPAFLPLFGRYDDYGRIEDVEVTKGLEFIENFFGVDIGIMINEVDDNSVGRGDKKCSATKSKEIYERLTFGLELTKVYKKMASVKIIAYNQDRNTEFWLNKFGFHQIENNTVSYRYKYTWVHPELPADLQFHSDRNGGHLFNLSTGKEQGYAFSPSYLEEELVKIPTYKSKLTEEDKQLCSIDLSILHTKLAIEEYEKSKTGDPKEDFRMSIMGTPTYKGYPNITNYLNRCHIDGMSYVHDSRNQPKELLNTVSEKEVADFIRFFSTVSTLNGKFQPSNYGNQDQDLKLHLEMVKCYRSCIIDSMSKYDHYDGQYDNYISEFKADNRDDKIMDILI
jgi:hypothetical protein